MPPLTQLGLHQVPVPPDVARAVDQDERCQQLASCPLSRVPVEDSHGPNSIRPDGIVMESLLPLPGLMRLDRFEPLGRSLSLSRSRTLLRRSGPTPPGGTDQTCDVSADRDAVQVVGVRYRPPEGFDLA